jgi:hypothetical protein
LREAEIAEGRLAQGRPPSLGPTGGVRRPMLTTSASYRMLAKDLDRSLQTTASEKPVRTATDYFLKNIGSVKSIDDFLKDTRLFKYAMKAFGLEEMDNAKAYMRKVLTEGVADPKSFANRLNDQRFVQFATAFNFAADGEATTARAAATTDVVSRYVRQAMEDEAGDDNEGVKLALYFQREAPNVTNAYQLLGDAALYKVVQTIFGFPDEMSGADVDQQAKMITDRLDIADLQDPAKLDRLISRFTVMYDVTENAQSDPILSLFDSSASSASSASSLDLIMTLNNLKHGGS